MASEIIPPYFKAENATLSFYASKDGKISVSYQDWDQWMEPRVVRLRSRNVC
jgi:hypothetical protein